MKISTLALVIAAAGLAVAATLFVSHAGPVNPPAGAVASTYKTLTEVEPRTAINATNTPGDATTLFTISQPGSYYLTSNVTGSASKTGIRITVSDVTVDLNGFALLGNGAGANGVSVSGGMSRIVIRNGKMTGWPFTAILASNSPNVVIENIAATCTTTASGFSVGERGIVRGCTVDSAGVGVTAGSNSLVADCNIAGIAGQGVTSSSGAVGITVERCRFTLTSSAVAVTLGNRSIVRACTSEAGSMGYSVGIASIIQDCVQSGGLIAFSGGNLTQFDGCVANATTSAAFNAGDNCRLTGCIARACNEAITMGSDCVVTDCSAFQITANGFTAQSRNTFINCQADKNSGAGFYGVDSNTYINCRADENLADGFNGRFGNIWQNCSARSNSFDGFESSSGGYILQCRADGNGNGATTGANIRLTGDACRVEGNSLIGGDFGIQATSGGNVIIRNSSRNSAASYSGIVSGNDVGPIGAAAASTSPWANIQY